jgi:hypothetical protein
MPNQPTSRIIKPQHQHQNKAQLFQNNNNNNQNKAAVSSGLPIQSTKITGAQFVNDVLKAHKQQQAKNLLISNNNPVCYSRFSKSRSSLIRDYEKYPPVVDDIEGIVINDDENESDDDDDDDAESVAFGFILRPQVTTNSIHESSKNKNNNKNDAAANSLDHHHNQNQPQNNKKELISKPQFVPLSLPHFLQPALLPSFKNSTKKSNNEDLTSTFLASNNNNSNKKTSGLASIKESLRAKDLAAVNNINHNYQQVQEDDVVQEEEKDNSKKDFLLDFDAIAAIHQHEQKLFQNLQQQQQQNPFSNNNNNNDPTVSTSTTKFPNHIFVPSKFISHNPLHMLDYLCKYKIQRIVKRREKRNVIGFGELALQDEYHSTIRKHEAECVRFAAAAAYAAKKILEADSSGGSTANFSTPTSTSTTSFLFEMNLLSQSCIEILQNLPSLL